MSACTDLVGPVQVVTFSGGPRRYPFGDDRYWTERPSVIYTPPRNTMDPRVAVCLDHHVACDCREAEWAEERQERHYDRQEAQEAVDRILAGHPIDPWGEGRPCQCTGCQLARAMHLWPRE